MVVDTFDSLFQTTLPEPPAEPGLIPWDCQPTVQVAMTGYRQERFLLWKWMDPWGRLCAFKLSEDLCVEVSELGDWKTRLIPRVEIPQEKKPIEPYKAVFTQRDLTEDELLDFRLFRRDHYLLYIPTIVLED